MNDWQETLVGAVLLLALVGLIMFAFWIAAGVP